MDEHTHEANRGSGNCRRRLNGHALDICKKRIEIIALLPPMSRIDDLRRMREAQFEAKVATVPKPPMQRNATKVPATKLGRPCIGDRPMTSTERVVDIAPNPYPSQDPPPILSFRSGTCSSCPTLPSGNIASNLAGLGRQKLFDVLPRIT